MIDDINQIKDFLLSNPKSLVMLFYLGGYLNDRQPSKNIIDRGKESRILSDLGLVKLVDDVHLHHYPSVINNLGNRILEYFDRTGLIKKFYDKYDFIDTNDFDIISRSLIEEYKKSQKELPDIWFLENFPEIGSVLERWRGNEKYIIIINDVVLIEETKILVSLKIICGKCGNKYIDEFILDENNFTRVLKSSCLSCSNSICFYYDIGYIF